MTARPPGFHSDGMAAEHALLLRHWGRVQARVTAQTCDQAARCAALEAEVMRLRARWMIASTQWLWGLGWAGLGPQPERAGESAGEQESSALNVTEVICQTGCASHAHPWRRGEGECRLTGGECTRVPPRVINQS